MTYKLEYISTFHMDVLQVIENLEEHPQKAKRIFSRIDKILSSLVTMPEMYPIYEDFSVFRKITIEDYLVFYIIDKQNGIIEVHRLLYGKMDIPLLLK